MPQLGETVTEGTITKWLKSVGEEVQRDEPLFEVSTDKVDSEVPSPAGGVLTEILVEEGDTVDVGVRLAVIGDSGSTNGSDAPEAATSEPAATSETGATVASQAPASEAAAPVSPPPTAAPATPPAAAVASVRSSDGLVLSPVVRKLLSEHGIDAGSVTGTGLGGRITRDDVEAVIASGGSAAPIGGTEKPVAVPDAGTAPAPVARPLATDAAVPRGDGLDEVLPFTNIRRRTAEHMVRSKATSAHTLMVKEVDYEPVSYTHLT